MPKPKGPTKVPVLIRVTEATYEWLQRKAGERKVPTYLAEQVERSAENGMKNERQVSPNFKKGGKK
jgi:hypothetical protein